MKDDIFFAEEIVFDYPGQEISKNEIDEIDDFPGKEDLVKFYMSHNGLDFIEEACFVPEECYNVVLNDDPYITLGFFLSIPVEQNERGLNINNMNDYIVEKYEEFEDFVLFHIPFALDVVDNPFWIDIQSGEIKYIDFRKNYRPDDVITVAASFKSFCKRITKRHLQR